MAFNTIPLAKTDFTEAQTIPQAQKASACLVSPIWLRQVERTQIQICKHGPTCLKMVLIFVHIDIIIVSFLR